MLRRSATRFERRRRRHGRTWTPPLICGAAKAHELYFLPDKINAAQALELGLVSKVVPFPQLPTTVGAISGDSPRHALREIKRVHPSHDTLGKD